MITATNKVRVYTCCGRETCVSIDTPPDYKLFCTVCCHDFDESTSRIEDHHLWVLGMLAKNGHVLAAAELKERRQL